MIIHRYIKSDIQENLWLNDIGLSTNDFSGQLNKLMQILSVKGVIDLSKAYIGHLFYLSAASFLVFYFGIIELAQQMFKYMCRKKDENVNTFYFYLFILISFAITITISAIFFINPITVDNIVYGRYNEIIIGPLLLLGFIKLTKIIELSNKKFIALISVFLLHTAIT